MTLIFGSLLGRLLLASLILLPLTLGTTGWFLERAHRAALAAAQAERLELQVLTLLAQAEFGDDLFMPAPIEVRLAQPNSGLYAAVLDGAGVPLWVSPSVRLLPRGDSALLSGIPALAPGQRHASEWASLQRYAYAVLWDTADGREVPLTFLVAESIDPREADVAAYRANLLLYLGATLLCLLLAQGLILLWGLRPLRTLSAQVARIEAGDTADLGGSGRWPREVRPLTDNLQTLLMGEQQRRERLRNTLADLAHSLKTPLAVLRSTQPEHPGFPALVDEQTARMEQVIGWHLQRASGGNHRLLQRTPVAPVLERLRATLLKVYGGRTLEFSVTCAPDLRFRGDERDLMEILGNLLDNACKYTRLRVCIRGALTQGAGLRLVVEDDGDGISPELRDVLLSRGARADSRAEGQGIGLAVVLDIVHSYRGQLEIGASELGGARVEVRFP